MRVVGPLQAMPGLGRLRFRQIMERLGISESRRVAGWAFNQMKGVQREFGGAVTVAGASAEAWVRTDLAGERTG